MTNFENFDKALFRGEGKYGIPPIAPEFDLPADKEHFISMNYALSTKARVIDVTTLRQKMASMSPNLQASLRHTGQDGSRSYGGNNGEALAALKLGYNVIQSGGYLCAVTRDAFVVEDKKYH